MKPSRPRAARSTDVPLLERRAPLSPDQAVATRKPPDLRASPAARAGRPRRGLIVTLSVSLGLHATAIIGALLLLRAGVPPPDIPEKPAEVELVMEEHKGDLSPTVSPDTTPPPRAVKPESAEPAPSKASDAAPTGAGPTASEATTPPVEARPDAVEATAPPVEAEINNSDVAAAIEAWPGPSGVSGAAETRSEPTAAKPVQQAKPDPDPPVSTPAPTISLSGTDSPSEAKAYGERIIPAAPDAVFHNRPPVFPREAAINGQHGTVVVLVHVSPEGTAAGVDLLRSSGYVLLDRAARDAVLRWRFLPAVKDGAPVASDTAMGFEFDNQ